MAHPLDESLHHLDADQVISLSLAFLGTQNCFKSLIPYRHDCLLHPSSNRIHHGNLEFVKHVGHENNHS